MEKVSLSNMDAFKIIDCDTGEVFYGCNQEWFGTHWQRLSGCGPSVVANILMYSDCCADGHIKNKNDAATFMEEVWKFVTPTNKGIPTTDMLLKRISSYAESKGKTILHLGCDIPRGKLLRPHVEDVASFLGDALRSDIPVAFLNLCNGKEENLDEWHWVTVVSMERRESDEHAFIKIIDRGRIITIDLSLWLETTNHGGGFIHFRIT
jgi:hypothetical protein